MRSSSGGHHYSSPHIGRMMLGLRTTVLSTRFHLTTVRWHFASEQYSWHILFAKYIPATPKQHVNSNQLRAICRHSLALSCIPLDNLLGAVVMPLLRTLKILFGVRVRGRVRGGGGELRYAFQIQHVNYQNIWLPGLHGNLKFFQGCIFRAVRLTKFVFCKSWLPSPIQGSSFPCWICHQFRSSQHTQWLILLVHRIWRLNLCKNQLIISLPGLKT